MCVYLCVYVFVCVCVCVWVSVSITFMTETILLLLEMSIIKNIEKNIIEVISKLIGVKLRNSPVNINYSTFQPGWTNIYSIHWEVKNPSFFYRGSGLQGRFSLANSPRYIQDLLMWQRFFTIFVLGTYS